MALLMHPFAAAFLDSSSPPLCSSSALFPPLFDSLFDACSDLNGARVRETRRGWTLTVPLPGVSPADVTVEARAASALRHRRRCGKILVHALPRFEAEYFLPRNAELAAASASLVDGELRVVVPIRAPETVSVPVAEGDLPADDDNNEEETLKLAVAGFAASQLSVTADPHARTLTVEGRRTAGDADHSKPQLRHVLALRGVADAQRVSAAAKNGLLHLRVPKIRPEEVPVPVSGDRSQAEAAAGERVVSKLPVPGVAADHVEAKLVCAASHSHGHPTSTLHLTFAHHRHQHARVRLPEGTQAENVRVVCCDGLLTVIVPLGADENAAAEKEIEIPLNTSTAATLSPAEDEAEQHA